MSADGLDVISFGAGEPDFPAPDYIVHSAKAALDKGLTRYTPSSGILIETAICKKFERDNNIFTPR